LCLLFRRLDRVLPFGRIRRRIKPGGIFQFIRMTGRRFMLVGLLSTTGQGDDQGHHRNPQRHYGPFHKSVHTRRKVIFEPVNKERNRVLKGIEGVAIQRRI
jgi:hypothetical protein